jgi:hypothetical protein
MEQAPFLLAWVTVLGAPPVILGAFAAIRQLWPHALSPMAVGSLATLCSFFGFAALRVSFTMAMANIVCAAVAYLAYCFLAASCWRITSRAVRILVLIVTAVPIAVGYLLGTIGVLGLAWTVEDYSRAPDHTEQMGPELICRVTSWGSAASDSGFTVHLYKHWAGVPFIEREVASTAVVQTNPQAQPKDASCSDVLAAYGQRQ